MTNEQDAKPDFHLSLGDREVPSAASTSQTVGGSGAVSTVQDTLIEAVLRRPVAEGEDVAFYLLHGCEGVSPEVESIMVREVARTMLVPESDAVLWCVNVHGPDDVYAMPDKASALERANELNVYFGKMDAASKTPEYDPIMRAVVIEWPHSAESHAEDMAKAVSEAA
jgi:hypothetical protein